MSWNTIYNKTSFALGELVQLVLGRLQAGLKLLHLNSIGVGAEPQTNLIEEP